MKQIPFSVPYNGDPAIVDFYIRNKRQIHDVYFGLSQSVLPSGRISDFGVDSKRYMDTLKESLKRLKKHDIACSLIINRSCEGELTFSEEIVKSYIHIIEGYEDLINNVVLFNPWYIKRLKDAFPGLTFSVSVNSNINSVERAIAVDQLGFDTIILDRDINHDKELICRIRESVSADLKILVNECCINQCVYRIAHFNLLSHPDKKADYQTRVPCVAVYEEEPWRMLRSSFILPWYLEDYESLVDIFKIAGRNLPTKILIYLLEIYFNRRHEGDMLSLLSSYGLYNWKATYIRKYDDIPYFDLGKFDAMEEILSCDLDCGRCDLCKSVWDRCLTTYRKKGARG